MMRKIKFFILIGLIVSLESCTSVPISINNMSEASPFDLLKLGQSEPEVRKVVGNPFKTQAHNDEELWIYNNHDKNEFQRASVSFDLKTKLVNGVTVIPQENEVESKLDFLQKQKFPASDYVAAPLGRCHRDYFPSVIFYISPSKGIIIEFDHHFNSVQSYAWTSTQYASDLI